MEDALGTAPVPFRTTSILSLAAPASGSKEITISPSSLSLSTCGTVWISRHPGRSILSQPSLSSDPLRFTKGIFSTLFFPKTVLYVFTGYISISGIISGTADAAKLKATKLAISGSVPVVGNILSDASEAVLVSAGLMKNAAGIYGVITMVALGLGPFLQVGVQYLLLNVTAGICHVFGIKEMATLIKEIAEVMGLVLAMIGTVCVIMLISIVCFMKGMA